LSKPLFIYISIKEIINKIPG